MSIQWIFRRSMVLVSGLALALGASTARAVAVPPGDHEFDASLQLSSYSSFNGTSFITPLAPPSGTLNVSLDAGALLQSYAGATFHILSGFAASQAVLADTDGSGSISKGDQIFAVLGSGTFDILDASNVPILNGAFTGATFTSSQQSHAATLNSSDANGLVLTPGAGFTFTNTSVSSILADPTGFTLSFSSIPTTGVTATGPAPLANGFTFVTLNSFGLSSGSVGASGISVVVPEPSTYALAGLSLLTFSGVAIGRRRAMAG